MDVNNQNSIYLQKKIRNFLVFFSLILCVSCNQPTKDVTYRVELDTQQQATQLIFTGDGTHKEYSVRLKGKSNAVFGEFKKEGIEFTFSPIIAFTNGETYEVVKNKSIYFEFTIASVKQSKPPKLVGMYPKIDTIPENLLKMYFVFDKPMQQTRSTLDFITVLNKTESKEVKVFLPLENELWNIDRTRLTLWLDPGRIKKDLIPNKEKGIPIKEGNDYEIVISSDLEDQEGTPLGKAYSKYFFVGPRDIKKPNQNDFKLTIPEVNTKSGLGIDFGESLDYFLITETIKVYKDETAIKGAFFISKKASSMVFIPEQSWEEGNYQIQIASHLEDLAGNNMNRLFDEDLKHQEKRENSKHKVLAFNIN